MNNNKCLLCPNNCGADRTKTTGLCGEDDKIRIAKFYLHKFEEPFISGKNGSGTVFFCGCSLRCAFCQNYELSCAKRGKVFSVSELADVFKKLEDDGANNINLVTPTHYADKIISALKIYRPKIPVVYNTHGYEKTDCLKKIDPFVDVYLPDLKFYSPALSERYTGKSDYFEKAINALKFMTDSKRLSFDNDGNMVSGVCVRHLVLPMNVEDSKKVIDGFLPFKDKAYLHVMSQYTPFGDLENFPELSRRITRREYDSVIDYAVSSGIENLLFQKLSSAKEIYIPQWDF